MGNKKAENVDWVYGVHAVEAALQNRVESIIELAIQINRDDRRLIEIRRLAESHNIRLNFLPREKLDELLPNVSHQGVAARCSIKSQWSENDLDGLLEAAGDNLLILILDNVQDPHNLGACLRTANAAGVDIVIAPKDKAVGITPVVRKVASGAAETTPFIAVTNLARVIRHLKEQGVWIIGTDDKARSSLHQLSFDRKIAIVLGSEGKGMRRLTRELCDEAISIPMYGNVSSLNVSVATGVILYEVVRQKYDRV